MLRSVARLVASSLLLTMVACARPAPRAPEAVAVAGPNAPAPASMTVETPPSAVIALNERQSVTLTSDGTMLDVAPETRVAIEQHVLTLQKEVEDGKRACRIDYGAGDPPYEYDGDYHGEGLSLVDARGRSTVLVEKTEHGDPSEVEGNAVAIDRQSASLVGVVGPLLFLHEDHVFFGCGAAHPLHGVSGFVWDASKRERVELSPPASVVEAAEKRVLGRGAPDESPRFVEAIPRFDAEGHLSIGWRFEKATTYAESEGQGSDYTISFVVESSELPARLAPFREPPPAIRNYLANGGEPIVGYSTL